MDCQLRLERPAGSNIPAGPGVWPAYERWSREALGVRFLFTIREKNSRKSFVCMKRSRAQSKSCRTLRLLCLRLEVEGRGPIFADCQNHLRGSKMFLKPKQHLKQRLGHLFPGNFSEQLGLMCLHLPSN